MGFSLVHCWLRNIGDSVNLLANYWLPLIQLLASTLVLVVCIINANGSNSAMVLNASEVDEQTLGLSLGEKTINKKWRVRTSKRQKADTQVPPTFGPYEGSGANRKKRASKRKKPAMRARRARASEKSQVFEISRRNHMFCNGFAKNWTRDRERW